MNNVFVYKLCLDGGSPRETRLDALLPRLEPKKREKINKLRHFRDKERALFGSLLVKYAICAESGLSNTELLFSENAHGKPYLTNCRNIEFNISHSGRHICAAVNGGGISIGIDAEEIRPVNLRIAARFFSADEREYIDGKNDGEKTSAFFEIWTKKESYIKMKGTGFSTALNSFSVFKEETRGNAFFYEIFRNSTCGKTPSVAFCHLCCAEKSEIVVREVTALELEAWFKAP